MIINGNTTLWHTKTNTANKFDRGGRRRCDLADNDNVDKDNDDAADNDDIANYDDDNDDISDH